VLSSILADLPAGAFLTVALPPIDGCSMYSTNQFFSFVQKLKQFQRNHETSFLIFGFNKPLFYFCSFVHLITHVKHVFPWGQGPIGLSSSLFKILLWQ